MTKIAQTLCSSKSSMCLSLYVVSVPTKRTVLHSYIGTLHGCQGSVALHRYIASHTAQSMLGPDWDWAAGPVGMWLVAEQDGVMHSSTVYTPHLKSPLTFNNCCWPCEAKLQSSTVVFDWSFVWPLQYAIHMYKLYDLYTIFGHFSQQQ